MVINASGLRSADSALERAPPSMDCASAQLAWQPDLRPILRLADHREE